MANLPRSRHGARRDRERLSTGLARSMGEPKKSDQWPSKKPLPSIDDPSGVQARLLRAGYNAGPITGAWNDKTRRALLRFQVERALEPTGELDPPTKARLVEEDR